MGFYDKFKKTLKKSVDAWTRSNWPELSLYCGCCELSTGIYIRCVATVVVTAAAIIFNCILLISLIYARNRIRNTDMTTIEDLLDEDSELDQTDLHGIFKILDGVVAYFILWSNFKVLYIIRNIWTIFAVYKKSRRSLKLLLYIGIPCWIFEGCLTVIAAVLFKYLMKGLLFVNFMFEGYNLLAIHSKHKEISGKSRIVKDVDMSVEIINPPNVNDVETPEDRANQPHCITCKCYESDENNSQSNNNEDEGTPDAATSFAAMWSGGDAEGTSSDANKREDTLNFKDSAIIYNQEILQGAPAEMATPTCEENVRPPRPTTLAIRPLVTKEKTDLCDMPVIYDEGQYNVGASPIIERT